MNLGLKVMINALAGWNGDDKLEAAIGKTVQSAEFKNDKLKLSFTDGTGIYLFDDGQSCCENRYMTTDDDVANLSGQVFHGIEIREAPDVNDGSGDEEPHEVQFLAVKTDKGEVVFETHNEHNGYYGGFSICCRAFGDNGDPDED